MILHLPFLLLGLALLWFPRGWMRRGWAFLRRRRRSSDVARITEPWHDREPGDPHVAFRIEFTKFRNYLDLLRGGAGSIVLMGGIGLEPAIARAPGASSFSTWEVLAIVSFIFLVGLLVQTLRYEKRRVTFYPPIFYLAGLSIGLCDVRAATFAFVMIWAINPALPNAQAFLTVYAAMMVIFGTLFAWSSDLSAMYAGVLCFLPVLLSLLAKRPLLIFARKSTRAHGHT